MTLKRHTERPGQPSGYLLWCHSLLAINPQAELAKVICPTLLLRGTADAQVSTATNLAALEKGFKVNE